MTKAPKSVQALTTLRPSDGETSDEWATARHYANLAGGLTQVVVVAQIMCGFELIELQRRAGLQRGGDRKSKPSGWFSSWPALVKEKIGRSDETARNWMNMARAVRPRLKKLEGPWQAPALLDMPPSQWPEGACEAVAESLKNVCDEGTQSGWMKELGLIKKAGKARGGDTSEKHVQRSPEEELAQIEQSLREDASVPFNSIAVMGDAWKILSDSELRDRLDIIADWSAKVEKWLSTPRKHRPLVDPVKARIGEQTA